MLHAKHSCCISENSLELSIARNCRLSKTNQIWFKRSCRVTLWCLPVPWHWEIGVDGGELTANTLRNRNTILSRRRPRISWRHTHTNQKRTQSQSLSQCQRGAAFVATDNSSLMRFVEQLRQATWEYLNVGIRKNQSPSSDAPSVCVCVWLLMQDMRSRIEWRSLCARSSCNWFKSFAVDLIWELRKRRTRTLSASSCVSVHACQAINLFGSSSKEFYS